MVGLRIDRGGGRDGAAKDWNKGQQTLKVNNHEETQRTYNSSVSSARFENIKATRAHTLTSRLFATATRHIATQIECCVFLVGGLLW